MTLVTSGSCYDFIKLEKATSNALYAQEHLEFYSWDSKMREIYSQGFCKIL